MYRVWKNLFDIRLKLFFFFKYIREHERVVWDSQGVISWPQRTRSRVKSVNDPYRNPVISLVSLLYAPSGRYRIGNEREKYTFVQPSSSASNFHSFLCISLGFLLLSSLLVFLYLFFFFCVGSEIATPQFSRLLVCADLRGNRHPNTL